MFWKRRARKCRSASRRSARRFATRSRRAISPSARASSSRWSWNFSSSRMRWWKPFPAKWQARRMFQTKTSNIQHPTFNIQRMRLPSLVTRHPTHLRGAGNRGINTGSRNASRFTKASACRARHWRNTGRSRRSWRITPAPAWTFCSNSRSARRNWKASPRAAILT